MILFNSDYTEGAHPRIMERLVRTNLEQTPGYGEDSYCRQAAECIRAKCEAEDAAVHFLVGGTQTNVTVISAGLKTYQGVIAPKTGHINVHETGAVEAAGHKILALPHENGKLTASQVAAYVDSHRRAGDFEHMVQPKMVYLSNPTELGTIYSKAELEAISQVCRSRGLYLFLDGARLGYGLMCKENDLSFPLIAKYCDAFYIGGTKVGALFGEAVVITNPVLAEDFRYVIKQKGGMLAKGRLLGLQFLTLFEENLYFELSAHAIRLAIKLKEGLIKCGFELYVDSPTNQQFFILEDGLCEKISEKYRINIEAKPDQAHTAVRFCTSWATREEAVDQLLSDLHRWTQKE